MLVRANRTAVTKLCRKRIGAGFSKFLRTQSRRLLSRNISSSGPVIRYSDRALEFTGFSCGRLRYLGLLCGCATRRRNCPRARFVDGRLKLHEGGESYIILQTAVFTKNQVSPTRDTRFHWMQSVVNCSHYVTGASEQEYLHPKQNPDVTFVHRDPIERSDEAYTDFE